ncbi:NAD(P)-binding domain-containing protein [Bradyrhizobium sediminis]|uniref:NAD(P)-binding domain-containing protein n=1 Tax=Bradyrhizobium sediminis TaxID=2840469 RepID=A0A975NNP1_9BRAD|nr:NAD(P)-binding domain-containing protein [Bradyrhizobium sediminis]QWG17314.1 NAD(P)-binding domain-containing protein [Bradyrhizobium sediminis]
MTLNPAIGVYALIVGAIWAFYIALRVRAETRSRATKAAAAEAGLLEPASLHPKIDPLKCLGCGACARACPEGDILGMINGKAELIEPSHCIGHGACKDACPRDAITLVYGTEKRGVDIPYVHPDFQTNVPGIFIAGELGGMGLIRNAIEQGRQAIDSLRKFDRSRSSEVYDVIIVGAGPAGFSASLSAIQHKLRFLTIEQDSFGGTVAHFPRGKLVMTAPVVLPLVGTLKFREVSKEDLLEVWREVARKTGLKVNYGEQVETITQSGSEFTVQTTRASYRTTSVLLAIGRRGTPRKLEVEGEDQSKVVYRLIDPQQYRECHVLVVGGGDSALEAAASIAEQPGTTVTLSHRSDAFSRAKAKNRERVATAEKSGRLTVLLQSSVKRIGRHDVEIEQQGRQMQIRNDAVIVCAGGILPTAFLKSIGIEVETKYGTA